MTSGAQVRALPHRLASSEPLVAVELRPPRADLEGASGMDAWMGMRRAVRRLSREDTVLFLTDSAVGEREEENLHHLVANLGPEVPRDWISPFLTCKHTLEYCLWYADRAVSEGHRALTVLGGDAEVGPHRCVPHSYLLRQKVRERHPDLALGGWANPGADPEEQAGYLADQEFSAHFYLTQIVSHHDLTPVERFLEAAGKKGVEIPGVFGVFYYRSANPRTLEVLSRFFPVPGREITRDFEERHLTAAEICARTIRALRELGVRHTYVSNLPPEDAHLRLARIKELTAAGP